MEKNICVHCDEQCDDLVNELCSACRWTCSSCSEVFSMNETSFSVGGDVLCRSCLDDQCSTCSHCNEMYYTDHLTYARIRHSGHGYREYIDGHVCDDCLNADFRQCDDCGEWYEDVLLRHDDNHDTHVCQSCFDDRWCWCEDCGCILRTDDSYEINGDYYCRDCKDHQRCYFDNPSFATGELKSTMKILSSAKMTEEPITNYPNLLDHLENFYYRIADAYPRGIRVFRYFDFDYATTISLEKVAEIKDVFNTLKRVANESFVTKYKDFYFVGMNGNKIIIDTNCKRIEYRPIKFFNEMIEIIQKVRGGDLGHQSYILAYPKQVEGYLNGQKYEIRISNDIDFKIKVMEEQQYSFSSCQVEENAHFYGQGYHDFFINGNNLCCGVYDADNNQLVARMLVRIFTDDKGFPYMYFDRMYSDSRFGNVKTEFLYRLIQKMNGKKLRGRNFRFAVPNVSEHESPDLVWYNRLLNKGMNFITPIESIRQPLRYLDLVSCAYYKDSYVRSYKIHAPGTEFHNAVYDSAKPEYFRILCNIKPKKNAKNSNNSVEDSNRERRQEMDPF